VPITGQGVLEDIASEGWHCHLVPRRGSMAPYAYSVGLYQAYRHPELVIFGQDPHTARRVLNRAVLAIRHGEGLDLSRPSEALMDGCQCRFVALRVSAADRRLDVCRWYYGGVDFPAYEIVWSQAAPQPRQPGQMGSPPARRVSAAPQMRSQGVPRVIRRLWAAVTRRQAY
jgi:hypothetical protein